ncbi:MAG: RNA-binding domain-containing protein [Phascolarctobacterium sp.]
MTIEEILAGESKNIEFKESLPEKSIKYMKTIVAFANGLGGKLIIGVEDGTRKVVGVDKNDAFAIIDSITNAISDSCKPAIIPEIYMQDVKGDTIIIVDVDPGRQRPYYIASEGLQHGVYVRVAGTTRPADEAMVKELLFEGNNRFFDKTVCLGLKVTEAEIDILCKNMKAVALRNCINEEEKALVKDVTIKQLISWGILVEQEGRILPTNAYAILAGADVLHCTFQCAVFKDDERTIFVDRREFTGPVQDIIESAYNFVLRNIHLGAVIEGLYRQDVYEIPPAAIRELIINAAVHRSYLDNGSIQVAVFDNRLEITSPGKLPLGQTIKKMREGYSKIRNEALAMAFNYMHLIERWGTGMLRIAKMIREAGLNELEIKGGETELRFNIYRNKLTAQATAQGAENKPKTAQATAQGAENELKTAQATAQGAENKPKTAQATAQGAENELKTAQSHPRYGSLTLDEQAVFNIIFDNTKISITDIYKKLSWTRSKTVYYINKLKGKRIIEREGSSQKGCWKIL